MTVRIIGIAGSMRRGSFNRRLLYAAAHDEQFLEGTRRKRVPAFLPGTRVRG